MKIKILLFYLYYLLSYIYEYYGYKCYKYRQTITTINYKGVTLGQNEVLQMPFEVLQMPPSVTNTVKI